MIMADLIAPHEVLCPQEDNIDCGSNKSNLFLGPTPTYISLISSTLSCIGAGTIIITYILFKDLRTGSRSIITFLSIADFFTAFGYIVGGANYLRYYKKQDTTCKQFDVICTIQSFITTWSQLSSYTWTCGLALYLLLTIVFGKNRLANQLIPLFHIIAWGLPIFVAFPMLVMGRLGYSPYAASNWCFIKDEEYQKHKGLTDKVTIPIIIARTIPESLTYLVVIILYASIKCFIFKMKRRLKADNSILLDQALQRIDNKLILIPLAFVLLRIWGIIQFFFVFITTRYFGSDCVSPPLHVVHFTLGILEAIGEGGQGWANALLFIVLNPKSRKLIYYNIVRLCCTCCSYCQYKRVRQILEGISKKSKSEESISYYETASTINDDTLNSTSTGLHEVGGESFHTNKIQVDNEQN